MLVGIFGAGRNGTTLLVRLLDGGPDLWMHPVETNYLEIWDDLAQLGKPTWASMQNATTKRLRALDRALPTETLISEFRHSWRWIDEETLPRLGETLGPQSDPASELLQRERYFASEFLPAFIESTRRAYGGADHPARALGFKTLETPYVADYVRVFPQLRAIHLIRDPVTNYASLKRTNALKKNLSFYG